MANLKTLIQFRGEKENEFQKQYRVGEDVLIMFVSKDQIYVRDLITEHWRLYHRGMQIKGTFRSWKYFRDCLIRTRKINNQKVYDLGLRYEIDCMGVYNPPILDEEYKKIGG